MRYLRIRIGVLELAKLALKLVKLLRSLPLLTSVIQQDGVIEVDQRVFPAQRRGSRERVLMHITSSPGYGWELV